MESCCYSGNPKGGKPLFVGGKFDDLGGKPSRILRRVYEGIGDPGMECHNGGHFSELEELIRHAGDYSRVYWFADVDNSRPKIIRDLKKINQKILLAASKRNSAEDNYTFPDLIASAIKNKMNVMVEFSGDKKDRIYGTVIDPLGNVYLNKSDDFQLVGKVLARRIDDLSKFTRIGSRKVGEALPVPEEENFFEIVRNYAGVFGELIPSSISAGERFFGNASFRCVSGFPSMRKGDKIYVSRRNIEKKGLDKTGFVAVNSRNPPVEYYGDSKPSVDTPIQLSLYEMYPNVNYMLHSHTYIREAPFTDRPIPCGALEEKDAIAKVFPDREATDFFINLSGHGSLALVSAAEKLRDLPYYAREIPEFFDYYIRQVA